MVKTEEIWILPLNFIPWKIGKEETRVTLKELNTANLLWSKTHTSGLEYNVYWIQKKGQLTLESLWRPVLASSAGERPNAICITFFPARNILEKKMQQL